MPAPEIGKANKITVGQRFLSLVDLDARLTRVEAKNNEFSAAFESLDKELDGLVKMVDALTKTAEQHQKFGHPGGK